MSDKDKSDLTSTNRKALPELKKEPGLREPSFGKKLKSAFIADEVKDVKNYVIFDVIVPAVKRTLRDLVMNSIDITLFGKASGTSYKREDRGGTYVSYNRYSDRSSRSYIDAPSRSSSRDDEIIGIRELDRVEFYYEDDAKEALAFIMELVEDYDFARVSDFLSVAHKRTTPVHNKWGWYDLEGARAVYLPGRDCWIVDLPKPTPLD